MTEAEFQADLIRLAGLTGYEVMHVRTSIGRRDGERAWQTTTSIKGWPDLFVFGVKGHFAVEVKSEKGRLSPEQVRVIDSLRASGLKVYVWRPSDLDEAIAVFRGGPS